MAIDVKAEARGIAENYFDDGCPANSLAGDIDNLVTRAVAEAKREQMEQIDQLLRVNSCGCLHAIRSAFAATEPRDIGREIVTDLTAMCKEQDRSRPQQERFEKWCEDTLKDACLDQVFMSTDGVPPNPYDDERTKVLYACWLAAQSSDARQRFDKAAVELAKAARQLWVGVSPHANSNAGRLKTAVIEFDSAARELGLDGAA